MKRKIAVASRWLVVPLMACISAGALAQEQERTTPAPATARSVGGHVGVAVPLVMINEDDTTTVDEVTVIATPIGIGFKLTDRLLVDFETIIQNPVDPSGTTGFVVDPGLVYNFGAFAAGLRVAFAVNQPANVGLIPLINKGIVDLGGGATWFIEAAFPTFLHSRPPDFTMDVVLHTGIGF